MNRTVATTLGAVLILIIMFAAIVVCQNTGKALKTDVTAEKIYTLSAGTKSILGKLTQPIKAKLYFAKTASREGSDQIRFYTNYYEFVKALLEEYVAASKGAVQLEVIDPRPYSAEEQEAMKAGLEHYNITQEEKFFFGLVIQTEFGTDKSIPFFSPDRQNFVEYDISYLIDTAITRKKQKIGLLSSLPVLGDEMDGYMAQMMRMQGQQPQPSWTVVKQLKRQYEVEKIATDVNDINGVDLLMVVHPKDLPEKTLFAIDQYVVKGGRAIVCVDPYCFRDQPDPQSRMSGPSDQSSSLGPLLRAWGLDMPANTFAGDRELAVEATVTQGGRPEKIIGYLGLVPPCFNKDNVISSQLNQVRVLFPGVLNEVPRVAEANDPNAKAYADPLTRTPLLLTTAKGNTWKVSSPYDLMMPNPSTLMRRFSEGTKPVAMAYLVTGQFPSAYPNGISIEVDRPDPNDPNQTRKVPKQIAGLTQGTAAGAVVVVADVVFMTDGLAYQDSFFGKMIAGDNSALVLNALDDLAGSSDLISIRSRGSFRRPFTRVDAIEQAAEKRTSEEAATLNAQIEGFNQELRSLVGSLKEGQEDVVGSTILTKRREIEGKIRDAQRKLNDVKRQRREEIERLGDRLRQANMFAAPVVILIVAIVLGIRRGVRRRHYISHASDA